MSDEEEKMLIGSIVVEYREAKQRLVAVGQKAQRLSHVLLSVGNTLKHNTPYDELSKDLAKLPTREEVEILIAEQRQAAEQLDEAEKKLRELGLSLPSN
jgi:hypothetical protein